jgi:hypothetical protein
VRYNNPGFLKFAKWEKEYGAVQMANRFAKFPTYSLGKQAQLRLLRSVMTGRMVPYYRPEMTIDKFIRAYASSSPEIEKANYWSEFAERSTSQNDNHQDIALKVFFISQKTKTWKTHLSEDWLRSLHSF